MTKIAARSSRNASSGSDAPTLRPETPEEWAAAKSCVERWMEAVRVGISPKAEAWAIHDIDVPKYFSKSKFEYEGIPEGMFIDMRFSNMAGGEVDVLLNAFVTGDADWAGDLLRDSGMSAHRRDYFKVTRVGVDDPVDTSFLGSFTGPVRLLIQAESRRRAALKTFPKALPLMLRRIADQLNRRGLRVDHKDVVEEGMDDLDYIQMVDTSKPIKTYIVTVRDLQEMLGSDEVPEDVADTISGAVNTFKASGGVAGTYLGDATMRYDGLTFKVMLSYKADGLSGTSGIRLAYAQLMRGAPARGSRP